MIPPFFRVRCLEEVDSTNLIAKNAAQAGEPEGLVIQALRQSAGKGRRGRTWDSPEGNLYLSVLLRPRCPLPEACFYSFAAALAVYEALAHLRGEEALQFKWPNDVLIDGKKISGILLEAAPVDEKGIVDWLVMGVGINVASHPDNPTYPATSLAWEGALVPLEDVRQAFLRSLHHWCLTLHHDGFNPVRRAWLADARRGPVRVRLPDGDITGDFGGLDETGSLILRLADGGEKVIQAGDVFFL